MIYLLPYKNENNVKKGDGSWMIGDFFVFLQLVRTQIIK